MKNGLLRRILERCGELADSSRMGGILRPLINAADGFFFRGDKVTTAHPHIRDANNLKRMFTIVVLALLPCTIASVGFYGWRVLLIIMTSYLVGVCTEAVFAGVRKREISEGAFVTCLIFPLTLPPDIPLWMVALGIFVGTFFGKEVFGGTGYNIFNPALVGRVFLFISFPAAMTGEWPLPHWPPDMALFDVDGMTGATPLAEFKRSGAQAPLADLFLGNVPGSIGEGSALMILIGGLFLLATKAADWRIPLSFIGASLIVSYIMNGVAAERFAPPLFQILSGGLLFGAFFMATDPVTSPFTKGGRWLFGAGCGLLSIIIRGYSGYAEGVMFSILFMNIFVPLIDEGVMAVRFRGVRG